MSNNNKNADDAECSFKDEEKRGSMADSLAFAFGIRRGRRLVDGSMDILD